MPERGLGRGRTAPFFLVRSFKVRHCLTVVQLTRPGTPLGLST